MLCPFCSFDDTSVKDSRASERGQAIRRRRFCPKCGSRFTTFERVQLRPLQVRKSNQRLQPFDREKLYRSIDVACRKRPVSDEHIEQIVSSIQRDLERSGEHDIESSLIGEKVMSSLRDLDKVAFVRFASVYLDFTALTDFQNLLVELEKKRDSKGT